MGDFELLMIQVVATAQMCQECDLLSWGSITRVILQSSSSFAGTYRLRTVILLLLSEISLRRSRGSGTLGKILSLFLLQQTKASTARPANISGIRINTTYTTASGSAPKYFLSLHSVPCLSYSALMAMWY